VPEPDPALRRGPLPILGEPPSPMAPPPGCAFHPRCPHPKKDARCTTERPLLHPTGTGAVACHHADGA
ncbi:MAG TPA: oligopeptide/dipeptide ABC transporter ATP-binding protein, partial [Gemmatimonadales bacterium]|nr:oligopeptide/dipeptide ABC transporter ATP-binding protein [Gemmatimonadales bacterium]